MSRRARQQPLPLQDTRATAADFRAAADAALRDPFHTPAEREDRRQHYLRQADAIDAANRVVRA